LKRVVEDIEQNPAQFIAGKKIESVELPQ